MQRVQYTNGTMRGKLQAGDAAGVADDLGTLQSLFTAAQMAFAKKRAVPSLWLRLLLLLPPTPEGRKVR